MTTEEYANKMTTAAALIAKQSDLSADEVRELADLVASDIKQYRQAIIAADFVLSYLNNGIRFASWSLNRATKKVDGVTKEACRAIREKQDKKTRPRTLTTRILSRRARLLSS